MNVEFSKPLLVQVSLLLFTYISACLKLEGPCKFLTNSLKICTVQQKDTIKKVWGGVEDREMMQNKKEKTIEIDHG